MPETTQSVNPYTAAIISAAGNAIGTTASVIAQNDINRKTRAWNEKMYARQRADALSDYQRSNEYNSPTAQMARLRAAGINPALYATGGATSNAAPVRSSTVPSLHQSPGDYGSIGRIANDAISTYQNTQIQASQLATQEMQRQDIKASIKLKDAQALQAVANSGLLGTKDSLGKFSLGLQTQLRDNTVQAALLKTQGIVSSNEMINTNISLANQRIENLKNDVIQSNNENARRNSYLGIAQQKLSLDQQKVQQGWVSLNNDVQRTLYQGLKTQADLKNAGALFRQFQLSNEYKELQNNYYKFGYSNGSDLYNTMLRQAHSFFEEFRK